MINRIISCKLVHPEAKLPERKTAGAAGYDLRVVEGGNVVFGAPPLKLRMGICVEIPEGYAGLVLLRSSLGAAGLCIPHGVGTIDSDYRGEMFLNVASMNRSHREGTRINERVSRYLGATGSAHEEISNGYVISPGDRVAQLVIVPVEQCAFVEVPELSATERGAGGYGSTGKRLAVYFDSGPSAEQGTK